MQGSSSGRSFGRRGRGAFDRSSSWSACSSPFPPSHYRWDLQLSTVPNMVVRTTAAVVDAGSSFQHGVVLVPIRSGDWTALYISMRAGFRRATYRRRERQAAQVNCHFQEYIYFQFVTLCLPTGYVSNDAWFATAVHAHGPFPCFCDVVSWKRGEGTTMAALLSTRP